METPPFRPLPPVPPPRPRVLPNRGYAGGTLVLGDAKIVELLDRPDVVSAFPFLKSYRVPVRRGCCGGRRQASPSSAGAAAVKAVILGMSAENKAKLREILGAKEIVVFTLGPRGAVRTAIR